MVDFSRTRRHTSESPKLVVDPGLPLGRHTVELIVTNANGESSPPERVRFEIVRARRRSPRRARPRRRGTES